MRIRRSCHWLSKPRIGRLKIVLLGVFTILLSFLYLVVLTQATGGYNEECLTPEWKRQIIRTMVQNISRAFDKFNVRYWIDSGKLYFLIWLLASKDMKKTPSNFGIGGLVCAWAVCIFSKHKKDRNVELLPNISLYILHLETSSYNSGYPAPACLVAIVFNYDVDNV